MRRYLARMKWTAIAAVVLLACGLPAQAGQEPSAVFMGKASIQRYECCNLIPVKQATDAIIVLDAGNGEARFQFGRVDDPVLVLDAAALTGHHGYVLHLQPAIYQATITPASGEPRYLLLVDMNGG